MRSSQNSREIIDTWGLGFIKKNYFEYFFLAGFLFSAYIFVDETFLLDSPRYFSVLKFFWFCYMFSYFFRKVCFFLIFDQSFDLVSCLFLNFEPTWREFFNNLSLTLNFFCDFPVKPLIAYIFYSRSFQGCSVINHFSQFLQKKSVLSF